MLVKLPFILCVELVQKFIKQLKCICVERVHFGCLKLKLYTCVYFHNMFLTYFKINFSV